MEIEYKPNNENIKTFTIGAQTQETAEKYARFLWERTKFGGHAGLPQEIHNAKRNRTLDHTANMYDMIDVFSLPASSCPVGTVVNFKTDLQVNAEGNTYVYPVTDTSKPMGYMLSEAKPDAIGVCVVSGVIEVPLVYMKGSSDSTFDRTNYVEYDIEECAFKFSNTGYPVFNVYQDVDGDWIAIILFGETSYKYDGPFATTIAGITGSTLYVDVVGGDIVDDGFRYMCSGVTYSTEDLESNIGVSTGETLWLAVYKEKIAVSETESYYQYISDSSGVASYAREDIDVSILGNTYSFFTSSEIPIDVTGNTFFYRIAENVDGRLIQIQYGDVFKDNQKISSLVSDGVGKIEIEGNTSCVLVKGGTGITINSSSVDGVDAIEISVSGLGDGTFVNEIIDEVEGSTFGRSISYRGAFLVSDFGTIDNVFIASCYDGQGRESGIAGYVLDGDKRIPVNELDNFPFIDGACVYLLGVPNATGGYSYGLMCYYGGMLPEEDERWVEGCFYTQIAYKSGGIIHQTQFGDVILSKSGFSSPNYSSLAITGDTVPDGLGHTFVLPVKAGEVGFFDDGGGAVGVWTDITGTTIYGLTNSTFYNASTDGWIRVSVIDSGTASNACLSIQDSTGNMPIYKYGSFGGNYKEGVGITITGETDSVTGFPTGANLINFSGNLTASLTATNQGAISLTGSTTQAILQGGAGILLTSVSDNVITISATSEGSVTGLTSSVEYNAATVSPVGGSGDVVFLGIGGTTIYGGTNGEICIGSTVGNDYVYDGPFAVKVAYADTTNPSTLYVYRNSGVISYENGQKTVPALLATNPTSLAAGESYWLRYDTSDNSISLYKGNSPLYTKPTQTIIELARNISGVLQQVQFGNVEITKPKLTSLVSGGTAFIGVVGSTNTVRFVGGNGVVLSHYEGDSTTISISVNNYSSFVTGITSSIIPNSATVSPINGSGSVVFLGVDGTTISEGINGEIVIGSTVSPPYIVYKEGVGISITDETTTVNNVAVNTGDKIISLDADLSSTITGVNEASVDITGSTSPVKFKAGGGITITAGDNDNEIVIASVITVDVDSPGGGGEGGIGTLSVGVSDGTASLYITGTTEYVKFIKGSGVTIEPGSNANEVIIGSTISGYTGTVTGITHAVGLGNTATISTIGGSGVVKLIGDGVSITSTSNNEIKLAASSGGGDLQDLSLSVSNGTASISLSGSTSVLNLIKGDNVSITGTTNTSGVMDSVIIGATVSGGGSSGNVGFPNLGDDIEEIESGTEYGPYDYDVWIIGYCGIYSGTDANITLYLSGRIFPLYDYHAEIVGSTASLQITNYVPVCIPISANEGRAIRVEQGSRYVPETEGWEPDDSDMLLKIYRCY